MNTPKPFLSAALPGLFSELKKCLRNDEFGSNLLEQLPTLRIHDRDLLSTVPCICLKVLGSYPARTTTGGIVDRVES